MFTPRSVTRLRSLAGGTQAVQTALMEPLEARQMMAVIAWDGGPTGNGTSWTDPANWAGDVLPGAGDDATIGATGTSPLITLPAASTINIRSFTLSRALDLRGTLATTQPSSITASGSLAFNGTTGRLLGGNLTSAGAITVTNSMGTIENAVINGEVTQNASGRMVLAGNVSVDDHPPDGVQLRALPQRRTLTLEHRHHLRECQRRQPE